MIFHVNVSADLWGDLNERSEECVVVTIVIALTELFKMRDVPINRQDIWWVNDFFFDLLSILTEQTQYNSVENETFKV